MTSPILGHSPEFQTVMRSARLVAATNATVLLLGESGTGKELLARMIHDQSRRHHHPLVTVNCAAMPESLAETELFGHVKGAFTGADATRTGRVQAAHGGTLFLDEIGELPLAIQAKLLRFLESGECQPVGDAVTRQVDVRVIAATNQDLHAMVAAHRFRRDLYFRLNVVPLELPPLRRRTGEVTLLVRLFIDTLATSHQLPAPSLDDAVMDRLLVYPWPGNIRELRNLCERLVILHAGQRVLPHHLPPEFAHSRPAETPAEFVLPESGVCLETLEKQMIRQALDRSRGNQTRAAKMLNITRDALLYRIKKHTQSG